VKRLLIWGWILSATGVNAAVAAEPAVPGASPTAQAAASEPTPIPLTGQNRAAQEIITAQERLAEVAADFKLTVAGAARGAADLVAEGQVWLASGRRYRVQYRKPEVQVLVSDGRQRWLYLKKINQVQIQPLPPAGNPSEFFLELGGGLPALVTRCHVRRLPEDGGARVYELTPRPGSELQFQTARLWLAGDNLLPRRVEVKAARRVRVDFTRVTAHTRKNVAAHPDLALDPDTFLFTPPQGAEVIEPLM
jgi:outer membrane lipoprotein-sorting protein